MTCRHAGGVGGFPRHADRPVNGTVKPPLKAAMRADMKTVFGIFAALAEYERELISERTLATHASARAHGRKGGRPPTK